MVNFNDDIEELQLDVYTYAVPRKTVTPSDPNRKSKVGSTPSLQIREQEHQQNESSNPLVTEDMGDIEVEFDAPAIVRTANTQKPKIPKASQIETTHQPKDKTPTQPNENPPKKPIPAQIPKSNSNPKIVPSPPQESVSHSTRDQYQVLEPELSSPQADADDWDFLPQGNDFEDDGTSKEFFSTLGPGSYAKPPTPTVPPRNTSNTPTNNSAPANLNNTQPSNPSHSDPSLAESEPHLNRRSEYGDLDDSRPPMRGRDPRTRPPQRGPRGVRGGRPPVRGRGPPPPGRGRTAPNV